MSNTSTLVKHNPLLKFRPSIRRPRHRTLSSYFPPGTQYFYGYPAGEDSGFLNRVPPEIEELVAARAFSCAGSQTSVVCFAATRAPLVDPVLLDELGIPQLNPDQTTVLPKQINAKVMGKERNELVKDALKKLISPGTLVMAQPFTDKNMEGLYQIPSQLTTWLNDKNNMSSYIPSHLLVERLAVYGSGSELEKTHKSLPLPCVIKASSSSSGDGVYLCRIQDDIKSAIDILRNFRGTILVEEYINSLKNYAIHFGIPKDKKLPIDILGVHEQLTSKGGAFVGSIINPSRDPKELEELKRYLKKTILPRVRQMGWYGIGCFDVLADKSGKMHIIDPNFRMTGVSAYHLLIANRNIKEPLVSFSGSFNGNQLAFEAKILPVASKKNKNRILQLIALSHHENTWQFNGALFFKNYSELISNIRILHRIGIKSAALDQIVDSLE